LVKAPEDRRLRLRIGINIGDVMLEDGDIYMLRAWRRV
jgi:class 3 adenylate cyclase